MNNSPNNTILSKRKAQSSLEYAIYIAMVIIAFSAMFFLFRNYTAGRMRSAADVIGFGEQYEP